MIVSGGQPAKSRRTAEASVAALVRRSVASRAEGQPFTVRDLLGSGPRAAVDQALHRMCIEGQIERVARGVYARPRFNQTLGVAVPATPDVVVAAIAKSSGNTVGISGAEAARRFGFSTQVPLNHVYVTTGRSRTIRVGGQSVVLRHSAHTRMQLAATPAGDALAALLYLGRNEVTHSAIETVRTRIGEVEYQRLLNHRASMPAWLSDFLHSCTEPPAAMTAAETS